MSSLALPKFHFTVLVSFVGSDSNLSLIANSLKLISLLSALHFFLFVFDAQQSQQRV